MKLDAWEVNKNALQFYKKHFLIVVWIGFLSACFSYAYKLEVHNLFFTLTLILLSLLVTILLQGTLFWFAYQKDAGQSITLLQSFQVAFTRFPQLLGGSLVVAGISFGGTLLLIIPGFIWGFMFSQTETFIILKKQGIKQALSSSKQLTKGNLWLIFRATLILGFPLGVVLFISNRYLVPFNPPLFSVVDFMLSAIISPIGFLVTYYIWKGLSTMQKIPQQAE